MTKGQKVETNDEALPSMQISAGKTHLETTEPPPNGGYGWVIVAATFMCATITYGIAYSFGVLIVSFVGYFQVPKENVAWIGSLLSGFTFIVGPLASALVNKFGSRPVAIAGGLISSVAFLLSTIAPNTRVLAFTYGILGGSGLGLIALANLMNVNYYFSTKRKFAVGVALTGSSVGNFIIPPFVNLLLEQYDWKGTLMIISGLCLNSVVFSALMRPLKTIGCNSASQVSHHSITVGVQEKLNNGSCREETIKQNISNNLETPIWKALGIEKVNSNQSCPQFYNEKYISADIFQATEIPSISESHGQNSSQKTYSPKLAKQNSVRLKSNKRRLSLKNLRTHHDLIHISNHRSLKRRFTSPSPESTPVNEVYYPSHDSFIPIKIKPRSIQDNVTIDQKTMANGDLYYDHNIKPQLSESKIKQNNEMLIKITKKIPPSEGLSVPVFQTRAQTSEPKPFTYIITFKSILDTLKEVLNFSLLKETTFLITCVAYTIGMMGYFIPFAFLPHASNMRGIDRGKAVFLISVLGIANISSRLVIGLIAEKVKITSLDLNTLCVYVSGGTCLTIPFCFNYTSFVFASIIYGFFTAPFMCLYSVVLVEMLGLEKLSSSLGILSLFRGVGYMFGLPIAGALFDLTDNYDASFYVAGTFLLISASLMMVVSRVIRRQENRPLKMLQDQVQPISAIFNIDTHVSEQK